LPKHLATPGSNSKRLKKRNGARTSLKRSQLWLYRPKNQQSQTQFLHYVSKTFFPLLSDLHSVLISLLHCGNICHFFLSSEKECKKKGNNASPSNLKTFFKKYFKPNLYLFVCQPERKWRIFPLCPSEKKIVPTSSKSEINFYAFDFRFVVPH